MNWIFGLAAQPDYVWRYSMFNSLPYCWNRQADARQSAIDCLWFRTS